MLLNFFGHLKTVITHKWWVFYYCCKSRHGLVWRGIVHDLSKFNPIEFIESVRYYQHGKSSPINAAKKDQGYSLAWQHHKGRNSHHYEYWIDYLDKGGIPIKMPIKYINELICDYLGAARAYMGKKFSLENEYVWWLSKINGSVPPKMHEITKNYITRVFELLAKYPLNVCMIIAEAQYYWDNE